MFITHDQHVFIHYATPEEFEAVVNWYISNGGVLEETILRDEDAAKWAALRIVVIKQGAIKVRLYHLPELKELGGSDSYRDLMVEKNKVSQEYTIGADGIPYCQSSDTSNIGAPRSPFVGSWYNCWGLV